MQIGSKLKSIREAKKISQQEVAHYLDISQKTYSNMESDKTIPSLMHLSKLSEYLDFDLLDLLKEQGVTFNQSHNKIENNGIIHNTYPENFILQFEARLNEKQDMINLLKEKIARLENGI